MYDLMIYSLKTGACLAVFYLFFKLLLSRETFHRFNRMLLLGAVVASFLLPICVITVYHEVAPLPEPVVVGELPESVVQPVSQPEATPFPWEEIAGGAFLLGVVVSLGATARSLWGVMRRIRNNPREVLENGVTLVCPAEKVTPFSWWRYIVISERDLAESGAEILLHEGAHIRMRHSVDLLVTDIAGCLQWFNPAMWLLRRELRDIHEYEADEAVLESGADARQYQMLLIKKAAGGRWYSVANSFNHSKLKNRITMMLRKKSSRWAGAKALLALPLAGLALGAFAETVYVFPEDKDTQKKITTRIDSVSDAQLTGKPLVIHYQGNVSVNDSKASVLVGKIQKEGEKTDVVLHTIGNDTLSRVVVNAQNKKNDVSVQVKQDGGTHEVYAVNYSTNKKDGGASEVFSVRTSSMDATVREIEQAVAKQDPSAQRKLEGAMRGIEDILSKEGPALKKNPELRTQLENTLTQLEDLYLLMVSQKKDGGAKPAVVVTGWVSDKEIGPIDITGIANVSFDYSDNPSAKPLLVIDGKETALDEIKSLNPKDVESISVLKGASAVEVYGDKAENGVLIVQTKKGAQAKSELQGRVSIEPGNEITLEKFPPAGILIFIDGKKVSWKDFDALDKKKVKRMEILKGAEAIKKFGEEGSKGVLEILTRK